MICKTHSMIAVVAWGLSLASTVRGISAEPAYRILGSDKNRVAIVSAKGELEWEVPCRGSAHDLTELPNGNVLFIFDATTVKEVNRNLEVVWSYQSLPKTGYQGKVEVHAVQRLDNGLTLVAESGNQRLVEVDSDGHIVHEVPLQVEKPNPHRDTRQVRKLANGNYLVCHENDGKVSEYNRTGQVVWSYALDLGGRPAAKGHGVEGHGVEVFGAIRLPNGNTLIGGGNNNRVLEVNPQGEVVWSIGHNELPGIQLAWVTTVSLLPNGNILVGNCHAGPKNPQLFEVTRDKKVVWTFNNFEVFGNGLAVAQPLGVSGIVR